MAGDTIKRRPNIMDSLLHPSRPENEEFCRATNAVRAKGSCVWHSASSWGPRGWSLSTYGESREATAAEVEKYGLRYDSTDITVHLDWRNDYFHVHVVACSNNGWSQHGKTETLIYGKGAPGMLSCMFSHPLEDTHAR